MQNSVPQASLFLATELLHSVLGETAKVIEITETAKADHVGVMQIRSAWSVLEMGV